VTEEWLKKVNYPKLRKQRALLRAVAWKFQDEKDQKAYEALIGLNHLLDDLVHHAASVLGERRVFGVDKNENCLRGLKCPKCKKHDQFVIAVTTAVVMSDDGCDDPGDMDWGALDSITCTHCDHHGRVWEFQA
jgi:hypothetical protein